MVAETTQLAAVGQPQSETGLERADPSAVKWARERIDLIKKAVCPSGISDSEFQLFIEQCKRADLDPLLKEAFCIPRSVKVNGSWVTRHEMQASAAGMEGRADQFPDYRGMKSSCVYEGDEISIDTGSEVVTHKTNPLKRGKLIGAWAQVFREGRSVPYAWCDLEAYKQDTPLWRSKPGTMLVKCARVAALRLGYPRTFGSTYIGEEMPPPEGESAPHLRCASWPDSGPAAKKPSKKTATPVAASAPVSDTSSVAVVTKASVEAPQPDVVEGAVVAEAATAAGSKLRVTDVGDDAEPNPSEAAVASSPAAPDAAPSMLDELIGLCGTMPSEEWKARCQAAQRKGQISKSNWEKLREVYDSTYKTGGAS